MNNSTYYVVRNITHVEAALKHPASGPLEFLCTNFEVHSACLNRGLSSKLLHDDRIGEEHRKINKWVYEKLISWIARCEKNEDKFLFIDANFYNFKTLFIRAMKYLRVLSDVLPRQGGYRLCIFECESSIFSIASKAVVERFSEKAEWSSCPDPRPVKSSLVFSPKNALYDWLGRFMKSRRKTGKKIYLMSGSLMHLEPVIEKLKTRGDASIIFCEQEFNLEKYRFCRRRGMDFVVIPKAPRVSWQWAGREFISGQMVYEGNDYSEVFNDMLQNLGKVEWLNLGPDIEALKKLIKSFAPDAVVLDEDFAVRRAYSAVARHCGTPCFVVSHGVPNITLLGDTEQPSDYYASAVTFVQSDYEKNVYASLYYDPQKISITGVPRYDKLFTRQNETAVSGESRKQVLYCGTVMQSYNFLDDTILANFLGHRHYREYLEPSLRDLIEAVWTGGAHLTIKPHYDQKAYWASFLKEFSYTGTTLVSLRADIFKHETQADLVVTPASTVVLEAIFLDKPVIVLNYGNDHLADVYEKKGVALVVRNKRELLEAVQQCLTAGPARQNIATARHKFLSYFVGAYDGCAADRVAEAISV